MTTTVTVPVVGSPYQPIEQRTTTTTVTESSVRGPRLRLFLSGVLQLAFGGLALIPVLILGPIPLTIACCACLAFTGMLGLLGACICSTKAQSSVQFDGSTGQQRVVTEQALFPRLYFFLVIVGFFLAVATAVRGIVIISDDDHWYHNYAMGGVAVGVGVFLALNQMLMICCIVPLIRNGTRSSEHVTIQPVVSGGGAIPISSAYQGTHPYLAPAGHPSSSGANSPLYPYIDEPVKEEPPSYNEATRHDVRPTAPPEKV
ncbi:hypothetical protein BV898_15719 [Hypsibius exemplaris]|uniref:Uncharacterized protein n=1 Tax=Hypsibius exemplaris TaxID=2072580 RepID=A0A9X6NBN8_HYPEX|nr:hypothetical protein BV898_15719 [Hypsibius exemplaris]